MSFKAKDLTYDSTQPAFLQRLRGQVTGDDALRHEIPIPRNNRLKQDDEEDAPTYVFEETNQSLTKAEYEAFVSGKDEKKNDELDSTETDTKPIGAPIPSQHKNVIAKVGKTTKKRKAVKVIGGEEEDEADANKVDAKVVKKPKKKIKPVKLSFGDQEGD